MFLEPTLLASLSARHWGWKWKDVAAVLGGLMVEGRSQVFEFFVFVFFVFLLKDNCFTEFVVFCQASA